MIVGSIPTFAPKVSNRTNREDRIVMAVKRTNELTVSQEIYAQSIAKEGLTQRKAFIVAYPHASKWKPSSVDVSASKLNKLSKVTQRITELRDQVKKVANDKYDITIDRILEEYAKLAFLNPKDYQRKK